MKEVTILEWNDEKAHQIVQKHKKRFSWRLTLKVVRVIAGILFIYFIYTFILFSVSNGTNIIRKTEFYQKLAIDWTYPGLSADLSSGTTSEITPLLTQKIEIPLLSKIGSEDYVVAHLNLKKRLITDLSHVEIEKSYPYSSFDSGFNFNLPYAPDTNDKLKGDDSSDVWETLEKVHEGNVANLAFSTDEYYSPEDIIELIGHYDLHIVWMPLYMGEIKEFSSSGTGSGNETMSLLNQWGLAGARVMDKDFQSGSRTTGLELTSVEDSQNVMLDNMQMMLENDKNLAEQLLGTEHLQERYDYLKKEGFQAFGAIVTGPVKELLKLKEVDEIHSAQLGEIKHWNWVEE